MPKCPVCLLAYVTFAGAAVWSHSLVITAAALTLLVAIWIVAAILKSSRPFWLPQLDAHHGSSQRETADSADPQDDPM